MRALDPYAFAHAQLATRRTKLESLQRESRQACDAAESALRELAQRTAETDALRCVASGHLEVGSMPGSQCRGTLHRQLNP